MIWPREVTRSQPALRYGVPSRRTISVSLCNAAKSGCLATSATPSLKSRSARLSGGRRGIALDNDARQIAHDLDEEPVRQVAVAFAAHDHLRDLEIDFGEIA